MSILTYITEKRGGHYVHAFTVAPELSRGEIESQLQAAIEQLHNELNGQFSNEETSDFWQSIEIDGTQDAAGECYWDFIEDVINELDFSDFIYKNVLAALKENEDIYIKAHWAYCEANNISEQIISMDLFDESVFVSDWESVTDLLNAFTKTFNTSHKYYSRDGSGLFVSANNPRDLEADSIEGIASWLCNEYDENGLQQFNIHV